MRLNLPRLCIVGIVLNWLWRWLSHCLELLTEVGVILNFVRGGLIGVPWRLVALVDRLLVCAIILVTLCVNRLWSSSRLFIVLSLLLQPLGVLLISLYELDLFLGTLVVALLVCGLSLVLETDLVLG